MSQWFLHHFDTQDDGTSGYFILFIFTARCTIVQSAVLRSMSSVHLSVHLSVTLVDQDHIG